MSATRILELSRPISQRHRMFFTPSSYHWYSFLVLKRLCQCYVYIPNSCLLNTSVIWTIPLPPRPYIKSVLILFQTVLKWIHQYLRECSWNGITGLCWTGLMLCNFLFSTYMNIVLYFLLIKWMLEVKLVWVFFLPHDIEIPYYTYLNFFLMSLNKKKDLFHTFRSSFFYRSR